MEEQGQERPGSTTELPGQDVLQALAALQVELSSEHEKNCRAYLHFMHKNHDGADGDHFLGQRKVGSVKEEDPGLLVVK